MKCLMRRVYRTGTYAEVCDVWKGANARPRGATRSARGLGSSRPEQVESNDKAAVRRLNATITGNFSYERGDLWVLLTLDQEHLCGVEELEHRAKLFLRAAARQAAKDGRKLKWILSVTDLDGDSGNQVRPHCHLVMSQMDADIMRQLWRYGTVDVRTLHRKPHHKALAAYIVRQSRHLPNAKKWTCSRNLDRTILVREYWVEPGEKYRMPSHAVEAEREYDPECGKQLYLAYHIGVREDGSPYPARSKQADRKGGCRRQ